jgi:hypothetical protein
VESSELESLIGKVGVEDLNDAIKEGWVHLDPGSGNLTLTEKGITEVKVVANAGYLPPWVELLENESDWPFAPEDAVKAIEAIGG